MKRKEKNEILNSVAFMSDTELKDYTISAMFDCLGSEADIMIERGYEEIDIVERRKYEKYLSEKSDILVTCCEKRGINLFDRK